MAECSVCMDDTDDSRVTPCCKTVLCSTCGTFETCFLTSATEPPVCVAAGCHQPVRDSAGWEAILSQDEMVRLNAQIARFTATDNPNGGDQHLPDDNTRRQSAWVAGAYVHGCGQAFGITDGCDIVQCPGCNQLVNITGGEVGAHTFYFRDFFNAVKVFSSATQADALDRLRRDHPVAWQSLFLDDLVATVQAGDPDGWLGSMLDVVWGPFVAFLRARVLPSTDAALDTSSLNALYTCIYQDPAHSADANLLHTLFSDHRSPAFAEQRRRMEISGKLTDVRLRDALKSQLTNDSWWT